MLHQNFQEEPAGDDVIKLWVVALFMMFFLTLGTGAVVLVVIRRHPVTAITGAAGMPVEHWTGPRGGMHGPVRQLRRASTTRRSGSAPS